MRGMEMQGPAHTKVAEVGWGLGVDWKHGSVGKGNDESSGGDQSLTAGRDIVAVGPAGPWSVVVLQTVGPSAGHVTMQDQARKRLLKAAWPCFSR